MPVRPDLNDFIDYGLVDFNLAMNMFYQERYIFKATFEVGVIFEYNKLASKDRMFFYQPTGLKVFLKRE